MADPFPGHEKARGFLSIPYLGHDGRVLTIRFRCLQDHNHREHRHGKYMSLPGDLARVYNVRAIHEATDEIHIAEGEFDALILTKIGLPAIALPGATNWRGHHRRMLAGFNRVYVWGDPDDAGAEMVSTIMNSLRTAQGVRMKQGDVTEVYLAGGREALLELIGRAE